MSSETLITCTRCSMLRGYTTHTVCTKKVISREIKMPGKQKKNYKSKTHYLWREN